MAKTHSKPGPKPTKGKRRDFHILLPEEDGLAAIFEQVAKANGGVITFAEKIIRERSEIITALEQAKGEKEAHQIKKAKQQAEGDNNEQ